MSSIIFGIMKIIHACWKSRKLVENSENACRKENGNKKFIENKDFMNLETPKDEISRKLELFWRKRF